MAHSNQQQRARPIRETVKGAPVTDEVIGELVKNAESGFLARPSSLSDVHARCMASPRTVTVRLDPDRVSTVQERAEREHTSASELMRRALDHYLAS